MEVEWAASVVSGVRVAAIYTGGYLFSGFHAVFCGMVTRTFDALRGVTVVIRTMAECLEAKAL